MTTLREAAQMALNDLEALVAYIKGSEPDLVMQVPSIEALRAALAQPEQEPPQREWQGLTDEEIEDACWTEVDQRLRSFARAIESLLREKNEQT